MAGGDKVAGIVFGADTTQLEKAAGDLNKLKQEAGGAAKAADGLGDSLKNAAGGAAGAGKWVTPTFTPLKKELSETERMAAKAGISVGQFTNAMRMLPAQFTDVATQLAGGQNPFLILLQQGGQVKDSFGGFRGMFTALASVITPTVLALSGFAVAVGGLGLAMRSVSQTFDDANKAIIQTSGYAFKTAQDLVAASASIAAATGASVGSVVETMSAVTKSGKLTMDEIERVTESIVRWKGVDDEMAATIQKNAEKISGKPLKALADLNEQYHFLSDSQAKQIVALKRSGDEAGAAALGLQFYTKAMDDMAKAQYENLPLWEKQWIGFKNAASQAASEVAVDFMTAGKIVTTSFGLILTSLGIVINDADRLLGGWMVTITDKLSKIPGVGGIFDGMAAAAKDSLKGLVAKSDEYTKEQANKVKYLNLSWAEARKEREKAFSGPIAPKDSDKATKTLEDGQKKITKQKQLQADAGQRLVDQANAETLSLQAQLKYLRSANALDQKASEQRKKLWNDQATFQVLEESSRNRVLTKAERQKLATKDQVLAQDEVNAKLGDQIVLQQKYNDLQVQANRYTEQSAAKLAGINAKFSGKTDRDAQREQDRQRLADVYKSNPEAQKQALAAEKEMFDAEEEGRSNWIGGVKKSFAEYAEAGSNSFQIAQDAAGAAFGKMNDALMDWITTGEASFKDFTRSILGMLAEIALKLAETMAIKSALSAMSYASGGYTGDGGKYQEAGIVHKGEFVMNKEATSRIGVANLYRMMRGYAAGGLVGGSGAGVAGTSGGAAIQVSTTVNVGQQSGTGSNESTAQYSRDMQAVIDESVQKGIDRAMKPGGRLYKYQNTR